MGIATGRRVASQPNRAERCTWMNPTRAVRRTFSRRLILRQPHQKTIRRSRPRAHSLASGSACLSDEDTTPSPLINVRAGRGGRPVVSTKLPLRRRRRISESTRGCPEEKRLRPSVRDWLDCANHRIATCHAESLHATLLLAPHRPSPRPTGHTSSCMRAEGRLAKIDVICYDCELL